MDISKRLIDRLHRVFNKDPKKVAVMSVSFSGGACYVTISDNILTMKSLYGQKYIELSEITLSELVVAINLLDGYSASLSNADYASFLARGLFEDAAMDIAVNPNLYYPTSLLWAEMRPYGWALSEQSDRVRAAEKQAYLDKSEGDWLEYWGKKFFGVERSGGETDPDYSRRIVSEATSLRLNNKAIEKALMNAIGIKVDIIDLGTYSRGIFYTNFLYSKTNVPDSVLFDDSRFHEIIDSAFGVYIHSDVNTLDNAAKGYIKSIIEKNRAAGKQAIYFTQAGILKTNVVGNNANDVGFRAGPESNTWVETII